MEDEIEIQIKTMKIAKTKEIVEILKFLGYELTKESLLKLLDLNDSDVKEIGDKQS